jgi:hypothetical protein
VLTSSTVRVMSKMHVEKQVVEQEQTRPGLNFTNPNDEEGGPM